MKAFVLKKESYFSGSVKTGVPDVSLGDVGCACWFLLQLVFRSVTVAEKHVPLPWFWLYFFTGFTFLHTLTNVCNFVSLSLFFTFEIFVVQKWFCVCAQLFTHLAAWVPLVSPVSYFNRDVFIKVSFTT